MQAHPTAPHPTPPNNPPPIAPQPSAWASLHRNASLLAALTFTEALPVQAWLLVIAAYSQQTITQAAMPTWFLLGAIALAVTLGHLLRRRPPRARLLGSIPLLLPLYLALLRISPSAYNATAGTLYLQNYVPLLALLSYCWLVGLDAGARPASSRRSLRRFVISFVALLLALLAAAILPPTIGAPVIGALSILLPLTVFCGLLAAMLSERARHHDQHPTLPSAAPRDRYWLTLALTLASAIVGLALLLAFLFNLNAIETLLTHLGPLGAALDRALTWLTDGLANLLRLLLDAPINALKRLADQSRPAPRVSANGGCQPTLQRPCLTLQTKPAPPPFWFTTLLTLFEAALGAALLALLLWLARRLTFGSPTAASSAATPNEESESLDGRALLAQQLRSLFSGPRRPTIAEEALPPTSTRALYRSLLRAAAQRGLARHPSETPDEYLARLLATPHLITPDDATSLTDLSAAYTVARYAQRETPTPERATLTARAQRLISHLSHLPRRTP